MSLDRLIEKIEQTQNPSVAGLDPKLDEIIDALATHEQAEKLRQLNTRSDK